MVGEGYGAGEFGEAEYGGTEFSGTDGDIPTVGTYGDSVWRSSGYEDATIEVLDNLPRYLNDDDVGPNADLLTPIGDWIMRLDQDMGVLEREMSIFTAKYYGSVMQIGKFVNVMPTEAEHIEHLRARIIAELHAKTSDGTVNEIITGVAAFLQCPLKSISYDESPPRDIILSVPQNHVQNAKLSTAEVAGLAEKLVGPTKRVVINTNGTFRFVSVDDGWNSITIGANETVKISKSETLKVSGNDYKYGFKDATDDSSTGGTFGSMTTEEENIDG